MNFKRYRVSAVLALLVMIAAAKSTSPVTFLTVQDDQRNIAVDFITAEDLKAKFGRSEAITVIDVRATKSYSDSNDRIKGAVYVKLRRLLSRLAFPPLKNVSHDSQVVTYCACPNDEASIRAAQLLTGAGFKRVRVLKGGWRMWLKAQGPVEPKPRA